MYTCSPCLKISELEFMIAQEIKYISRQFMFDFIKTAIERVQSKEITCN